MRRMLIFGGTFNPIHRGHLHLYRHFADALAVDRVLIIPTKQPPHKQPHELASGADRLEMCRLAAQDDPRAEVSDLELRRAGPSYTVDTLEELHARYPGAELYLAVGSDMLLTLDRWWRRERIVQLAVICALARRPGEYELMQHKKEELERRFGGTYRVDQADILEISSTELRRKIKEHADLTPWLPPAVIDYIKRNGLYQCR